MKLTLNARAGATSAQFAEALTIARNGGLDMAMALEGINSNAVASPLIGSTTNVLVNGDCTPDFPAVGMIKDFDLASRQAKRAYSIAAHRAGALKP